MLRESHCSRGVLHLLKIFFRSEGRMKTYTVEKHTQMELTIDRTVTGAEGSGPGQLREGDARPGNTDVWTHLTSRWLLSDAPSLWGWRVEQVQEPGRR